jgi:hypothetical protein
MAEGKSPEPWLRGTLTEVAPVQRAVLHALQLAREDVERWCGSFTTEQLNFSPEGIAPVCFHIRHIAGSIDRLLTYAEGHALTSEQIDALKIELNPVSSPAEVFEEFRARLSQADKRIRAFSTAALNEPRAVGKKQLPTTVAGLLVHVADHTLRHVGQAITTAKIVLSQQKASAA